MIVQCTTDTEAGWLRPASKYAVQAVYFDQARGTRYRIISDDAATPALFPASAFTVLDGRIPRSWRIHVHRNGDTELCPAAWLELGFWERFFDGDEAAKSVFQLYATPLASMPPATPDSPPQAPRG